MSFLDIERKIQGLSKSEEITTFGYIQLNTCPMCDSRAMVKKPHNRYKVICIKCGVSTSESSSIVMCVSDWNKRTQKKSA